ncbi:MAG: hypothetical protein QOE45_457 [Frankiaceae bacterium]|jgi:hypothetical protein|nr:hypothetical protein [Frankiaceae bacterium]
MSEITLEREAQAVGPVRRAPRRVVMAMAAAVVFTGGVLVALSARGPGDAGGTAFAMERVAGGTIAVRVVDSDVSARAMTRQLRAAGVDVRVETMPASPQLVGTWLYVGNDGHVPDSVYYAIVAQTHGYVATIEVSASLPGGLVLGVGRAPHRGEGVQVSGRRNALAPGGALYCTRLPGVAASVAAAHLATDGYAVRWADGKVPAAGTRIAAAYVSDDAPKTVVLSALSPSDSRFGPQSWLGFTPSARADADRGYSAGCPAQ